MYRLFILFAFFSIVGCTNEVSESAMSTIGQETIPESKVVFEDMSIESAEAERGMSIEPPRTKEPESPPTSIKVIRTGHLLFEVSDLNRAKSDLDSLLLSNDCYYEKEHFIQHHNRNDYSLTIRIPNDQFDSIIKLLKMDREN